MTETAKTVLFVAAAALSLVVGFAIGPSTDTLNVEELLGTRLNQFEVDVAKRLKIVKFDKETASTREFEVAESAGLWSIPSKQDYPADAARQMAEAATCLIDREVLRVAGTSANDHEALGVIDPSSSNLDSKAEGVGTRVTITDSNDANLTDMIIGKPVKDAEGQYHVRKADQDIVYVVNLDPEKLSTKFEDWIEDDLLKLNPMDIRKIKIKDYSAELRLVLVPPASFTRQISWDPRGDFELLYDDAESKWIAQALKNFDREKKEMVEFELTEEEQLNEEALRELKNGLDDLLIVDVLRKPEGLSSDLKAGKNFLNDREANDNLMELGFAPVANGDKEEQEIISSEGEMICTLQDGVEYVLRFGNLQLDGEGEESTDEATAAADADAGVNRYLFVMARFNESMLEEPELTELPELPEGAKESEEDKENTDDEAESEETEEATDDDENEDAEAESSEADDTATESNAAESTEEDNELAELIAAREAIEKENQRKLNEYQEKIESGKERVSELNARFGDWYYVIANDVYKKIHLSRDEVIKKKESEADSAAGNGATGGVPGLPNLPLGGGS